MRDPDIYSYVLSEENNFESDEIRVGDNWNWNFRDHIQLIFHLKNDKFYEGENDWLRSFKNIIEPLLNLAYWTEDLEVKDVVFYIENKAGRILSFFVKKYHDEVFVKKHDLDTYFDEITESDVDYGGVLTQRTKGARPEVIQLNQVAFCDQTDIMGGPIGFKHHFSPTALKNMSKFGWGEESNGATISLEELIILADNQKDPDGMESTKENRTTGKTIEVYIVRGSLPEHYLKDNDNVEDYYNQLHIIAYYTDKESRKHGVTLYRKKEDENNIKFHTSKKVHGRALGRGVGESLLHPQIWTNFLTIHKTQMLEAGARVPLQTDDPDFTNRNEIQDMENLEITVTAPNTSIRQIPTASTANIQLYRDSINEWFEHAQLRGSAFDPMLGKEAVSGTTFRGQERTVAQGRGMHDRRRGQRAKFLEEIYRDWIIPEIVREILKGPEFFATLTAEEMEWVVDSLAHNRAIREQAEAMLNLQVPADFETLKAMEREKLLKEGNKKMLKILKDEFKGIEIKMGINIAGKQKDLVNLSDKVLSIFQFIFANPQGFQQAMQIPALARAFEDILEFSGMNQAEFYTLLRAPQQQPQQPQLQQQGQPQQMQLNQPQQAQPQQ